MKLPVFRIKDARTRATAIAVLLLAIAVLLFYGGRYRELQSAAPKGGNLFIFFLINLNILLVTALIFLLARNAIKLYYEGRQRVFGYHLRTKLVLIFVGFTLIPTVLLFFVARGFITDSIDFWFNLDVEHAMENAVSVTQEYYSTMTGRTRTMAQKVSQRLGTVREGKELQDLVEELRRDYALSTVEVFGTNGEQMARSWDDQVPQMITDPRDSLVMNGIVGRVTDNIVSAEKGEFIKASAQVRTEDGQGAVVVSLHLPEDISAKAEMLAVTYRSWTEMKLQKRPIRMNYVVYLLVLAMLILFSATWLGFYLARGITIPIGKLAEGTEKVASGDLSVRVESESHDEIGILIEAFNRMTEELQTGRRQLEEAHRNLEHAYFENEERRRYTETVLRNVGTGVISIDPQGLINTFNRAAEKMFGVQSEEIMGRHYAKMLSPEHARLIDTLLSEVPERYRGSVKKEIPVIVQGRPLVLLINVSRLDDLEGSPLGTVLVLEDLTKLVDAQKKAAWSEVAKRIAHEIKNPLTPIKLSAERLRRRFHGELDEEKNQLLLECTDSIIREVEGMKSLVDEFSRFARLPALQPVPGNINDTINEAASLFAGRKEITGGLEMDLGEGIPEISYDREQMRRVIINLLENALQAVRDRGEGGVSVSSAFLTAEGMVAVSVADQGVGVADDLRDRIFDPYFSTKKDGTGLGLAITRRVVEEHGGEIAFEPNIPTGSILTVRIPVDIEPRPRG